MIPPEAAILEGAGFGCDPRVKAFLHSGQNKTSHFCACISDTLRLGKTVQGRASDQRAVVLQINPDAHLPHSPR